MAKSFKLPTMRLAILCISLLGSLLFGGVFALSFLNPLSLERVAREVVRMEVERRVGHKIDALTNNKVVGLAQKALERIDVDIERATSAIRVELPQKVAKVLGDMLDANCECRKRLVEAAKDAEAQRVSSLMQLRAHLVAAIESTYASVTARLFRELRIVSGTNALAFALLGIVTIVRPRAGLQLALPAVVLIGAALLTTAAYLFNQNWLHTVIFSDYVGMAFMAYMAGVALMLSDLLFNRARVLTMLINKLLSAVGSLSTVTPC